MEQDCSGCTGQRTLLLVPAAVASTTCFKCRRHKKPKHQEHIFNFPLPAFRMALMTTAWVGSFQALVSESVPLLYDNTYLCFDMLHSWSYMATHSLYCTYPETLTSNGGSYYYPYSMSSGYVTSLALSMEPRAEQETGPNSDASQLCPLNYTSR